MRGLEDAIADMERRSARTGRKVHYGLNPFVAIGQSQSAAIAREVIAPMRKGVDQPDGAAAAQESHQRATAR